MDGSKNIPLAVVCVNGSGVVTAPDSAPTVSIYEPGQDSPMTGFNGQAMTLVSGPSGFPNAIYQYALDPASSSGFASGASYFYVVSYSISSTQYAAYGVFTVT